MIRGLEITLGLYEDFGAEVALNGQRCADGRRAVQRASVKGDRAVERTSVPKGLPKPVWIWVSGFALVTAFRLIRLLAQEWFELGVRAG